MRRIGWIILVAVMALCLTACSSKKSSGSGDGGGAVAANFTASPTSGDAALDVTFSSTSTGTITSYSWDFGDGSTSTQANPVHTYTSDGTYTVILTVVGPDGSDTETKAGLITVGSGAGPTVNFEGTPTSGEAPLDVDFTDLSTGNNVNAWSWNFGDGGTSSEQNPSHTYSSEGTYDVTLSATDDDGTSAHTKNGYITVTGGGTSGEWEALASGFPSAHFYGIHFADANNGWCVGTPNILLHTTDGGATWTNQYDNIAHDKKRSWLHGAGTHVVGNGSPYPEFTFLDVHAVSANAAWVTTIGGSTCAPGYSVTPAFVTTDGGAEWIPVMTSSNFEDWAVWAFDADTAYICSIGFDHHHDSDIHTINGGYEVSRTNCYMDGLYDISFSGAAGWFVGKNILYTDGGALVEQSIPSGHLAYLGVDAISASTAWAVGVGTGSYSGKGVIGYTTDAGATWNDGGSVNVSHLYEIDFSDASNGYFVGAQGLICGTTDGGQNWTVMDSGTTNLITDIHALDSGHVWACGWSNTILRLK